VLKYQVVPCWRLELANDGVLTADCCHQRTYRKTWVYVLLRPCSLGVKLQGVLCLLGKRRDLLLGVLTAVATAQARQVVPMRLAREKASPIEKGRHCCEHGGRVNIGPPFRHIVFQQALGVVAGLVSIATNVHTVLNVIAGLASSRTQRGVAALTHRT
jgi:hypothetical protein